MKQRTLICKNHGTISETIAFLEKMKEEFGDIPVAIPRCPTKVVMGEFAYAVGYGENLQFTVDSISTVLESVGPEIEW